MKRIIAFCASSYQVLVLNKIIDQFYPTDEISIIIADTIVDSTLLCTNIKETGRYKDVFYWKIKNNFNYGKIQRIVYSTIGWPIACKILKNHKEIKNFYDIYLFSNYGLPMLYLGYILKHLNPRIKCELFEDGFNTYSSYYGKYLNSNRLIDKLTRRFFKGISSLYLFNPKILEWKPHFKVKTIESNFDFPLIQRLNCIFGYANLKDDYDKKVVFFEESYFADGCEVDDVCLVNKLLEFFKKGEIIIKIHPRNCVNRFSEDGFITNKNLSIPWELIVLNQNFSNTIFVTMASNAAMNPFFIFGKRIPVILLFKCSEKKENLRQDIVDFDERLCSKYPEVFFIPSNEQELFNYLKNAIERK